MTILGVHRQFTAEEADLVEDGQIVTKIFKGKVVRAQRDKNSGYVHFDPPALSVLAEYYLSEYGAANPDYYSVDVAYGGPANYVANIVENICSRLKLEGSLRIHEIGCSFGGVVAELTRRGHVVTGSDINSVAIEQGRRIKGNSTISACANKNAVTGLTEKVDVIYASHVLEHDPDCIGVIEASSHKLSERGFLLVMVPNAMYVRGILDGFVAHPWVAYPDHLHMFSTGSLGRLCDITGFEPLFISTHTSFEVDEEYLRRHFSKLAENKRVRGLWQILFAELGLGMELRFVLVPKQGQLARECIHEIALAQSKINTFRIIEQNIRTAAE